MKMGYFLIRYGTELPLLKPSTQIVGQKQFTMWYSSIATGLFLLLSGLTVKQGRLKTILY